MPDPPDDALPPLTDPPLLVAILVGAIRTGDGMMRELAELWLAALGVHVRFDHDSPVTSGYPAREHLHPQLDAREGTDIADPQLPNPGEPR